jgi:integrase
MARSLFGHVSPETKALTANGHLFNWLDRLPVHERPTFIADFTPAHLTAWRATWKFGSDLTAANRWTMVKSFFLFCERQGWIQDTPARKLKSLDVVQGSRTAIFTDEQYDAILDAVPLSNPENVPEVTRKGWHQRLTTFIELLRWSGMAIVDGVLWRPELVDDEGVLRYRRKKSGVLATVPLPAHVVAMLRDIPLERDSVGTHQPFRSKDTDLASDTATWSRRLGAVFALAGIKEVKNERGRARKPHVHMLRDTFAVWHLRHGSRLHVVSKMLGHAKTATTERAYLPWVKELEQAHIAEARRTLDAAAPKPGKVTKVINISRLKRK